VRIAFDIDGVLRDLMSCYVRQFSPPKSVEEIDTDAKAIELAGSVDEFYHLLEAGDCWRQSFPHLHILHLYQNLEGAATRILITANPTEVGRAATLTWLTWYGIDFDELHFCADKLAVTFDAIVEDHPGTALRAADAGRAAFLVYRPWTRDVTTHHANLFHLPVDEDAEEHVLDVLQSRL